MYCIPFNNGIPASPALTALWESLPLRENKSAGDFPVVKKNSRMLPLVQEQDRTIQCCRDAEPREVRKEQQGGSS